MGSGRHTGQQDNQLEVAVPSEMERLRNGTQLMGNLRKMFMRQTLSWTSIGNTQEPRDTSSQQNFFPSLSNPPSCRDITILKGGGCQRTPQSDSHYSCHSRHLLQSPIHPSTQTTKPPPAARDPTVAQPTCPTYVADLRVQPTWLTYVSDLRG